MFFLPHTNLTCFEPFVSKEETRRSQMICGRSFQSDLITAGIQLTHAPMQHCRFLAFCFATTRVFESYYWNYRELSLGTDEIGRVRDLQTSCLEEVFPCKGRVGRNRKKQA